MRIISNLTLAILLLLIPASHASNMILSQTSSYTLPTTAVGTGGFNLMGGGILFGVGNGKLTFQTGGAYVSQVLNGANTGHVIVPLFFRLRLAQALFARFGGDVNYNITSRVIDPNLVAGAGFDIPLGRAYGLVVAADYHYSFTGNNQALGWVGLRFGRP